MHGAFSDHSFFIFIIIVVFNVKILGRTRFIAFACIKKWTRCLYWIYEGQYHCSNQCTRWVIISHFLGTLYLFSKMHILESLVQYSCFLQTPKNCSSQCTWPREGYSRCIYRVFRRRWSTWKPGPKFKAVGIHIVNAQRICCLWSNIASHLESSEFCFASIAMDIKFQWRNVKWCTKSCQFFFPL